MPHLIMFNTIYMKKLIYLIIIGVILSTSCKKEDCECTAEEVNIFMGANQANDVYYSFNVGEVSSANRSEWDLAFSVPLRTATIRINEGAGVLLYKVGDTTVWEAVDTSGISAWEPTTQNQSGIRIWQLPGTLFFEEGQSATTALPSLIEELSMTPSPLTQGKTAIMRVRIPDGFTPSGSLGESEITFFPEGDGHWLALQGIHALTEPGLLNLSIDVTLSNELELVYGFHQRVLINEGDYGFQYLSGVPPETVDPEIIQPEDDLVRSLFAPRTENKLWSGAFEFPSRYYTEEFISFFGTRRNYNNGALLHYHTGARRNYDY